MGGVVSGSCSGLLNGLGIYAGGGNGPVGLYGTNVDALYNWFGPTHEKVLIFISPFFICEQHRRNC
jgi:hypothetical protein